MQLTISLLTTSLVNFCRGKMFVDEQRGITIGRKEDNDLVLIDETLCVSSHHASIYCQGNQFYLADTSTNGTFLNSSSQRIEKGSSVMLREGDKITIGPYDFLVKFEKSIVSQDANNNHGLNPNTEEKLFSGLEGLFSSNPAGFPGPGISSSQSTGSTIPSDVSNSNNSALDDDWLGEDDNNLPVSEVPNIQKTDSEIPKEPTTRIFNYDTSSSDDNSQTGLENNKDGQSSQSQAITSNQDINKALYWD
ncbi:FHA domain-containing protein, partial [Photobacterium sanctipauli]